MNAKDRLNHAKVAVELLKEARDTLSAAHCDHAANYVRAALKSAEGAVRHATRLYGEELRQGQCIHHIDGNPRNNDMANLLLVDLDRRA